MVRETCDMEYTYNGQKTTIPNVSGQFCPACNESIHNSEESEYLNAAMLSFNKEVNGATVNPAFISETRKKLKLDQREAAEIFGGGPNAFSRYENGKPEPPQALVQLFKMLNTHPDLINELRSKRPGPATAPITRTRLAKRKNALTCPGNRTG
jgi:HTH-type transcriptional regulator / antitoxin MqsA